MRTSMKTVAVVALGGALTLTPATVAVAATASTSATTVSAAA
ncbi:hypothetical protein ACFSTC_01335 [Nonomuraea ferruginea]